MSPKRPRDFTEIEILSQYIEGGAAGIVVDGWSSHYATVTRLTRRLGHHMAT